MVVSRGLLETLHKVSKAEAFSEAEVLLSSFLAAQCPGFLYLMVKGLTVSRRGGDISDGAMETPGQVETYVSTTGGRVGVGNGTLGFLCGFTFCVNSSR